MLRAVSAIYLESQALEVLASSKRARRDVFKLFRTYSSSTSGTQTVLSNDATPASRYRVEATPSSKSAPQPPQPPPPPSPRRPWVAAAAAVAVTASVGGLYFLSKNKEDKKNVGNIKEVPVLAQEEDPVVAVPSSDAFPERVQYLLVGAGTASFAAMRALRSLRPDAQVLIVGEEDVLPYMRPPLSKELWREPELAERAKDPHALTFRQWNGKRRSLVYEPEAFYTPVEQLSAGEGGGGGGASVARGWRVARLDVQGHRAELVAPGQPPVSLHYDKCLIATGSRPVRVAALSEVARAGRSVTLRGARDAARLAARLAAADTRRVAVVGGGFLAAELSAALADSMRDRQQSVVTICREKAPLAAVLPEYLAAEAQRRLEEAGAQVLAGEEVLEGRVEADGRVSLTLTSGAKLHVDLVVECAGCEPAVELARDAGLEIHPELGGVLVNPEMQARTDVYAAGDVSCFYDISLGRRRVEHHDHAVVSGRLAGENMTGTAPPKPYAHQSMFWSDLGPDLGYEAIGIIDSRLPTVGIFSADAVTEVVERTAKAEVDTVAGADAVPGADTVPGAETVPGADTKVKTEVNAEQDTKAVEVPGTVPELSSGNVMSRRFDRGVVFYVRERRVVGVLLWNVFNRMHVARQVLMQGEFDDLFEVGKLFSLAEEEEE